MQKGQMRANLALSLMSCDISCLPVSTAGARNFFPQDLQVTLFWLTELLALPKIYSLS